MVVEVAVGGVSTSSTATAVRSPATRERTKGQIRSAVDAVIASHSLSAKSAGPGQPAITRLTTVPAFAVTVTAAELDRLAKDGRVMAVNFDMPMKPNLDVTLPLIGMPSVHTGGGTGVGYSVAVIDTGVQRNHPFIGLGRLIPGREACFLDSNGCPNGTNEQIGTGAGAAASTQPHGTHVSGIVLGNRAAGSPRKGVAPAAKLIPINIFGTASSTSYSTIQRAFEYVEDIVIASNATLKIAAINMSVGGGGAIGNCDADPTMALLKPVIDSLRSRGVLSSISAGNNYATYYMGYPACLSSMVSVAATSRTGIVSSYTNISPTTDLFAPGGEFGGCVMSSVTNSGFDAYCGTSMAAPHVAGAIAVLKQKVPAATACKIENALKTTGLATTDTRSGGVQTKPRIRVNLALARLQTPVLPPNNNFANATLVPPATTAASLAGSNIGATLETGEARHVVATSHRSVWWRWTPSTTGLVKISTLGSGFDTVLAVYRGGTAVGSPGVLVAQNDNAAAGNTSSAVSFTALAGYRYNIVVAGKTVAQECSIQLNLQRPPANDNFAASRLVSFNATTEVGVAGSNVGATKEAGEPNHYGDPGATTSVWFRFTAPVSGPISIDTAGSPLNDTVLAVYTGNALNALTEIASDDQGGGGNWSRVSFNMVAGRVYRVALAGYVGTSGRYRLWFTPAGAQSLRTNLELASAE